MDTFGINWQFLLAQVINFLFLLGLVSLVTFLGVVILRRFNPRLLSQFLSDLSAEPQGPVIPRSYLGSSDSFELRRYGKALLLIDRGA